MFIPRIDILHRRKHLLPTLSLLLQEALEIQELRRRDFVLQMRQPRLVQRVNLELQELLLLVGEFCYPRIFVELRCNGRGLYAFRCCIGGCIACC